MAAPAYLLQDSWADLGQSIQDDVDWDFGTEEHTHEWGYAESFSNPHDLVTERERALAEISAHHP